MLLLNLVIHGYLLSWHPFAAYIVSEWLFIEKPTVTTMEPDGRT